MLQGEETKHKKREPRQTEACPHAFSSVQFRCSVVSNSLWPHGLQHAKLPCPSPIPRPCSKSFPLSWWCYPTVSSSAIPFSSCLWSFPASGFFPVNQFLASGAKVLKLQLHHVLPMTIQYWFPLDWLVWSPCSPKDSQDSSPTPQFKSINCIPAYWKNHSFD